MVQDQHRRPVPVLVSEKTELAIELEHYKQKAAHQARLAKQPKPKNDRFHPYLNGHVQTFNDPLPPASTGYSASKSYTSGGSTYVSPTSSSGSYAGTPGTSPHGGAGHAGSGTSYNKSSSNAPGPGHWKRNL